MFDAETLHGSDFITWNLNPSWQECNNKKQVMNTILWQIKCDGDDIVSVHIYGDYIYSVKTDSDVIITRIVEK